MKTPSFWYKKTSSSASCLLAPLGYIYQSIAECNKAKAQPQKANIPVICIGNLTAGGSGKTPAAIAFCDLIASNRIALEPAFITRGYKGTVTGPQRVDTALHDPALWGDEALLLARHAPTIVSRNRFDGVAYAAETGSDLAILDDGLQNYSLEKDLSFCVINGQMGFGNGKIIPAGPLRQTIDEGLKDVDACILIGEDHCNIKEQLPEGMPLFTAHLKATHQDNTLQDVPYLAFCGIGYPEKFKTTIHECGLNLSGFISFPDHHAYTHADLEKLVNTALEHKARLLTTEKDIVRLPDFHQKDIVDVLPVKLVFDAPETLIIFIKDHLSA